jgi:hypothetical protein
MFLEDRIKTVISDFVDAGTPFTILDISNTVKQDGNGFIRHRDIRPIAVSMILNNEIPGIEDYMSSQIQVDTPKGIAYATLYHLEDSDPIDYVNRQQIALKPSDVNAPVQTPSPIFVQKPVVNNLQSNAHIYKAVPVRKHDGAVQIPHEIMIESGITPGLRVDVITHPNSISIVPATGTSTRFMHKNFRISHQMLNSSNIGNSDTVNIAVFSNKIVIA